MPGTEKQSDQDGGMSADVNLVLAAMREDLGAKSQEIAVHRAIIQTQQDEINQMKLMIDELTSRIPKTGTKVATTREKKQKDIRDITPPKKIIDVDETERETDV